MKLNGWQRIGVVLSLIWIIFIAAVGYDKTKFILGYTVGSWVELPEIAFDSVEIKEEAPSTPPSVDCSNLAYDAEHLKSKGWTREEAKEKFQQFIIISTFQDQRVKADSGTYEDVLKENANRYGCVFQPSQPRFSGFVSTLPATETKFGLKGLILIGFGGVSAGWLLSYLFVGAFLWISAGFRGTKSID